MIDAEYLAHAFVERRFRRGGGERVIRLVLHHRPDLYAHERQPFFQHGKLRQQRRSHSLGGLVSGEELVPERLNHVIGGHRQVRRTLTAMINAGLIEGYLLPR